jgi:RNA polymerase sigma-70 factor, ECF subfamily
LDWDKIVKEIGPRLYRYFCGNFPPSIASDLVQETFIRLVRKVESGSYNEKKGSIASYAFGIAFYIRKEAYKAAPKGEIDLENIINFPVETTLQDELVEANEEKQRLRLAISKLPESEKEVILLLIDEDLTLEEIGNILHMPLGTVKSHVHRAKEKLRKELCLCEEEASL